MRRWLREGVRTTLLRAPHLPLYTTPIQTLALCLIALLCLIVTQWLATPYASSFNPRALTWGWGSTLATLWLCWALRARLASTLSVPALFNLLLIQNMLIGACLTLAYACVQSLPPVWLASWSDDGLEALGWGLYLASVIWSLTAQLWLLARAMPIGRGLLAAVLLWSAAFHILAWWYPSPRIWLAEEQEAPAPVFDLTEDVLEQQPLLLEEALDSVMPGRPGVIDTYFIAFAPDGEEDTFLNETTVIRKLMDQRFGAQGRSVHLVNHSSTLFDLPWATTHNLHAAILRMGEQMNPNEDMLVLYLTAHGGRDAKLSAGMPPLQPDNLTPQRLKTWLDEAGIRYRVIAVSACFSGSWVAPLASPSTLVMTAADADHTSYGCGHRSDFTFFGKAVFDEQLRHTYSLETAFRAARPIIAQREQDHGKTDGFSNPQIRIGPLLRPQLAAWEAQLAQPTRRPAPTTPATASAASRAAPTAR